MKDEDISPLEAVPIENLEGPGPTGRRYNLLGNVSASVAIPAGIAAVFTIILCLFCEDASSCIAFCVVAAVCGCAGAGVAYLSEDQKMSRAGTILARSSFFSVIGGLALFLYLL